MKRSVGVSIHFFSKQVLDQPKKTKALLELAELPLKKNKSISLGALAEARKNMSKVLIRKGVTYLEEEKKLEVLNHI